VTQDTAAPHLSTAMPGFPETTLYEGYGYIQPVIDPYVEKARHRVPLVDRAAKKAEELVPALITRVDDFAEPKIEKMRPHVEPRLEQVKEVAAPYVDGGVKYYRAGLGKVEQIKEFKDAKETQLREFKETKTTQLREIKDAKETQLREFAEPKVEKIKGFVEPKVTQIREFTDPKVEKIKGVVSTKKDQMHKQLLRVPGSENLQDLKYTTLLGKVASSLEKVEAFVDRHLPVSPEQKAGSESSLSTDSTTSSASDCSYHKINRSLFGIKARILLFIMIKVRIMLSFPGQLKTSCMDGTLKAKLGEYTTDAKCMLISKAKDMKSKAKAMRSKAAETKYIRMVLSFAVELKTAYMEGTLKTKLGNYTTDAKCMLISYAEHAKLEVQNFLTILRKETPKSILLRLKDKVVLTKATTKAKCAQLQVKAIEKVASGVAAVMQTSVFKKVVQVAVAGAEKTFGKEKTKTIMLKVDNFMPPSVFVAWKAAVSVKTE